MAERLYLTVSDADFKTLEETRGDLGMTRSQYLSFLLKGEKKSIPLGIRYEELVLKLCEIERDLKAIVLKDSLSDEDRLYVTGSISSIKHLLMEKDEKRGEA